MLQFQLKDTKDVAIAKPISTYVQENYQLDPTTELPLVRQAADELEQCRYKYYSALRGGEQTSVVKAAFVAYIQRLRPLSVRFTFGRGSDGGWFSSLGFNAGNDKQTSTRRVISIDWQYTDHFDKTKWITSSNINFEIANVCINYANRLTRDAHEIHDSNNEASINDTCQLYKEAAAIYQWLSQQQEICALATVSPDLSFDCLNFFSLVMFAQVQAMFPERAILKQSSAGIIAQLTAGTCKSYEDALAAGSAAPLVKGYLASSKGNNWLDFVDFQRLVHGASANLWYAKIQFETGKYGDELAYLYCARSTSDSSTKYLQFVNTINPQAVELRNKLSNNISSRLVTAEKDNSQVYFSKIPDSVPLVPAKVMANYADVKPIFDTLNDPFYMLVDSATRDLIISTQKELEGMVNAIGGGVQSLADQINRELHSMNLPGALEVAEQGRGGGASQTAVPDDLWSKINSIQTRGGLDHLERSLSRSKQCSKYIESKLQELRVLLRSEEEDDNQLRSKYGAQKWSRQKSADLIKPMLESCDTVSKLCNDATKADQICEKDYSSLKPQLQPIIGKDRNGLAAQLPRNTSTNASLASQQFVTDLRHVVNEVFALMAERDQLMVKARALLQQLLVKLRAQLGSTPDREKFIQSLRDQIHQALLPLHGESQIPKQTAILQRCNVANRTFIMKTQSTNDSSSQQLQDALQKYYTSVASYNRVRTNLEEGSKFYQNLTQDTVNPLEQRVKDYCMARDMEKSMWVEDLNRAMANMSIQPQAQSQHQYQQGSYNQPPAQHRPAPQQYYQPSPQHQAPQPSYGYQQPYGAAPQQQPTKPSQPAAQSYPNQGYPAQNQSYPAQNQSYPAQNQGYPGSQNGYGYNQGHGYR